MIETGAKDKRAKRIETAAMMKTVARLQKTKARRGQTLQAHKNEHAHEYTYLYTLKQCRYRVEYAYLLLTYLKTECRLYIAYIGTKEQKRKKA